MCPLSALYFFCRYCTARVPSTVRSGTTFFPVLPVFSPVSPYPTSPCLPLPCLTLRCPTLSNPALPYPVLPCSWHLSVQRLLGCTHSLAVFDLFCIILNKACEYYKQWQCHQIYLHKILHCPTRWTHEQCVALAIMKPFASISVLKHQAKHGKNTIDLYKSD